MAFGQINQSFFIAVRSGVQINTFSRKGHFALFNKVIGFIKNAPRQDKDWGLFNQVVFAYALILQY